MSPSAVTEADRETIRNFIREHHTEQVDFLAELVKVPSDNPPGDCARHAEVAAKLLEQKGFTVERHPVPENLVKETGMVSATNLAIRKKFGDGPSIALNAHGDVVPPGQGWTRDPYGAAIEDGHMYGRGVAVSKSDFATYTYALLALQASGAALNGTIELHFTYDEEVGGVIGPRWLLDEKISRPDYVICAGFSYGVVSAHNGCLHLEVKVRGKQAHAAMPHTGIDALEATTQILTALYGERKRLQDIHSHTEGIDSPAVTVGLISGGVNTNVVPDLVTLRLDRRLIPEENAEQVETDLRALIERSVTLPGARCEIRRIMLARPFAPVGEAQRIAGLLEKYASEIMGEPVKSHGVPLYTDARHYAEAGIPTVIYGAGPHNILEANAHGADEHLSLDDLRKATEVVACMLLDLLTQSK